MPALLSMTWGSSRRNQRKRGVEQCTWNPPTTLADFIWSRQQQCLCPTPWFSDAKPPTRPLCLVGQPRYHLDGEHLDSGIATLGTNAGCGSSLGTFNRTLLGATDFCFWFSWEPVCSFSPNWKGLGLEGDPLISGQAILLGDIFFFLQVINALRSSSTRMPFRSKKSEYVGFRI